MLMKCFYFKKTIILKKCNKVVIEEHFLDVIKSIYKNKIKKNGWI